MTTKIAQDQVQNLKSRPLAEVIADTKLSLGDEVTISDRANGVFDVVLSSTVTENTFNIVQCTGVATLSLVARIGEVFEPEIFGADDTGATITGAAIQAAMDYAQSNHKYLKAGGKYLIDATITVTGGQFGFEFGPSIDILQNSSYGLIWEGAAGTNTNEDTVTPMLEITDTSFITTGPISLNNRKNETVKRTDRKLSFLYKINK